MSAEISERSFEDAIECGLLQHGPDACVGDPKAVHETLAPYGTTLPGGYLKRAPGDYDRAVCLLPRDVVDFVLRKRFALIVDEAHSSQSGESTKSLKAVLSSGSLEEAEKEEAGAPTPEEELESTILAEMERRGRLPQFSTFALPAPPQPQTPPLFGPDPENGR